ncbi:hypothetical protein HK405_000728, partial [Cladochytrium tenue]
PLTSKHFAQSTEQTSSLTWLIAQNSTHKKQSDSMTSSGKIVAETKPAKLATLKARDALSARTCSNAPDIKKSTIPWKSTICKQPELNIANADGVRSAAPKITP